MWCDSGIYTLPTWSNDSWNRAYCYHCKTHLVATNPDTVGIVMNPYTMIYCNDKRQYGNRYAIYHEQYTHNF